ncbi:S-layer homology domain-containing protein [Brevibacillus sp. NSP2.1]|uniref:S-layer homology domain-containing protein n=1 Tax=Brevibacillus sp. NSP2.1 TaxID=3003229 RepID=UPI00047AAE7D|nr:S-layer homology domain-containing protein [Brevibacillus sp. NSP2.1]
MLRGTKSWGLAMAMSSSLLLTTLFANAGTIGGAPLVYAAEQPTAKTLTQEEALKQAQKWVAVPADYRLLRVRYVGANEAYSTEPIWRVVWEKANEASLSVTIDAVSGKLLDYSKYGENESGGGSAQISREQAEKAATAFLERVTTADERARLSKANEYVPPNQPMFRGEQREFVTFTRVENEIPFLENGFRFIVDHNGEVMSFSREWYEGKLPDAAKVIDSAEAAKKWDEQAAPTLLFSDMSMFGRSQRLAPFQLAYKYEADDPQFVDAATGQLLNALGKEASAKNIEPLGNTHAKAEEKPLISKEEAQRIAEQYIKKLPGSYRSEGSNGGGTSSGVDGVEVRRWSFSFTPLQGNGSGEEQTELSINDRGELVEYSVNENARFQRSGQKWEKAVTWEQAEASALKLVRTLYADRLGDIYLVKQSPSKETLQSMQEKGLPYEITFGWLQDGIPIEYAQFAVEVNPETGVAETLDNRSRWDGTPFVGAVGKDIVDRAAAKKAEQKQKTLQLTYYLPQEEPFPVPPQPREPILVYRYVGDAGVVLAETGEWLSFAEAKKQQKPSDIEGHPQQAALELALRMNWLSAEDGKLEPDKAVTRGELIQMIGRLTNRIEFNYLRPRFSSDEQQKPYPFADVDVKHPNYAAIQKGLQYGLIPKTGQTFAPDRTATRADAADIVARLLGYGDVLDKPEFFTVPYQDVPKKQVPAVALATAHGLLKGKSAASFAPEGTVSRGDVAEVMQALYELKKTKQ